MNLNDAYQHYRETGDIEPFLEQTTKDVILPFIRRNYFFLHEIKSLGIGKLSSMPRGNKLEKIAAEMLSLLVLSISRERLFSRLESEDNVENLYSYLTKTCENMLKGDRLRRYIKRFEHVFDLYPRDYYFWIPPKRVRVRRTSKPHKVRWYYLSQWPEIPDCFTEQLQTVLGSAKLPNWQYTVIADLKAFIDSAFDSVRKSLKIRHFIDFLKSTHFFSKDLLDVADQPIPGEKDDNEQETVPTGKAVDLDEPAPDDLLIEEDLQKFAADFLSTVPDKYRASLLAFARAYRYFTESHSKENMNDLYKVAATYRTPQKNANTIRNHLLYNDDAVFKKLHQAYLSEFGLLDEQIDLCFQYVLQKTIEKFGK